MQAEESRKLSRWFPARIQQLETERDQLLEKIAALPQHDPKPLPDRQGYHSRFMDPSSVEELSVHQIDVKFKWDPLLDSIALVPAIIPRDHGRSSYAFPKRFKIEVLEGTGRWVKVADGKWKRAPSGKWVDVVNWMDEDFPDPGPYPVFFSDINTNVHRVRMTVPSSVADSGAAYYALGELYLFRQQANGQIGENMADWGDAAKVHVSDSFSTPPLWDAEYLHDRVSGLGVPLSEEMAGGEDLMVVWNADDPLSTSVELLLDLGRVRPIGRIQLWPSEAPHEMAIQLFGFPEQMLLELSADSEFESVKAIRINNTGEMMHYDNLLNVICDAYKARYIRLTFRGLREYNGGLIFGLGEIVVSEIGEVWSQNCKVTAKGIPPPYSDQLSRLVDGYSRYRRILPESEWIRGLAQRRPLDRRLVVVERELEVARDTWAALKLRASIWGGGLIGFALLGAMGLQRLQRRKVLKRLRHRITRDLHDEVGSSLGGLSLTAGELEEMAGDGVMKRELGELSLMAREACASLREVVWVTDQDTIHLPSLIEKMVERAERVLRGGKVMADISPDMPDVEVSLSCKRHLIMFFREAIHNCARHAEAQTVRISIRILDKRLLELSIQDDGQGFDRSEIKRGLGLDSMKERAEELRGVLDLQSVPGEGTLVKLKLPLNALSLEPIMAYKTSN